MSEGPTVKQAMLLEAHLCRSLALAILASEEKGDVPLHYTIELRRQFYFQMSCATRLKKSGYFQSMYRIYVDLRDTIDLYVTSHIGSTC
jgi:hypothetical protein